jgi:serine/threonine protein kinase
MADNGNGQRIVVVDNRYQLVAKLGHGGMGEVYKGLDKQVNDEFVAIKLAFPEVNENRNPGLLYRFKKECANLEKAKHPNIVEFRHSGYCNYTKRHYLAMEYVNNLSLEQMLALSLDDKLKVVLQVANALQFLHSSQMNLIHRDIKTQNILVDSSKVAKLSDFGIIKDEAGANTMTETFAGSPHFAPPEQVDAKHVDHRADIYSLGSTLYHLLSGQVPYQGEAGAAILGKLMTGQKPTPLAEIDDSIPPVLEKLTEKMMDPIPELRYQTDKEIIELLTRYLSGEDLNLKNSTFFKFVPKADEKYKRRRRKTPRATAKNRPVKQVMKKSNNLLYAVIGSSGVAAVGALAILLGAGDGNGNSKVNLPPPPIVREDPRKEEFETLMQKINAEYKGLKTSYSESAYKSLSSKIKSGMDLAFAIKADGTVLDDIMEKRDDIDKIHANAQYSNLEKEAEKLASDLADAKQNQYSSSQNQRLESRLADISRKLEQSKVKQPLKDKLESYSTAIAELKARNPEKKLVLAQSLYEKAKKGLDGAMQAGDKRSLTKVYGSINQAKEVLETISDKGPEHRKVSRDVSELEKQAKEREPYLAEMILRFDNEDDLKQFSANGGQVSVNAGKMNVSGSVTYNPDFNNGDVRFYASGDFSVIMGGYELMFAGDKVEFKKNGKTVQSALYDNRGTNFVKLDKRNGFNVYVNGRKLVSSNGGPGSKMQLKSANMDVYTLARYEK